MDHEQLPISGVQGEEQESVKETRAPGETGKPECVGSVTVYTAGTSGVVNSV